MMYIEDMAAGDGIDRLAEAVRQSALFATRHLLNREELSVSAMEVLHTLSVEGPTRLTVLTEVIRISQPAMTQLIQRLERRELVTRAADPDDGRRCALAADDDLVGVLESRLVSAARTSA